MSVNGWFPKLRADGTIASGNAGIWLTDGTGSRQVSTVGTSPFWLGDVLCFNRNDGTTQIGTAVVPHAYNAYFAFGDRWTGFVANTTGRVDFYRGVTKTDDEDGICLAKPAPDGGMVYVAPYADEAKTLVYNNVPIFQGKVTNYVLSWTGLIAWQIATGTYTRQILNQSQILSVRDDEDPILGFEFLGQTYLVTQTQIGQLVYPLGSHFGYIRRGDLYYPDGRVFGTRLRLVGSTGTGEPLFDNWIDLTAPRVDLRTV